MTLVVALTVQFLFLGVLLVVWFGARPSVERFATANGVTVDASALPRVRRSLRRTYAGRVVGALAGVVALGGAAVALDLPPSAGGAASVASFAGLVVGAMVGIVVAQHRRRTDAGRVRQASLTARAVAAYAPRHATRSIALAIAVGTALGVLAVVTAPAGLGAYGPVLVAAAAALLIVPVGAVLQRRIVEAPRDDLDEAVDDALRRGAVRSVHHSVLGVLLCGIAAAGFVGVMVHQSMIVETEADGTVFTTPPGSTSLSVDSGLRQAGNPDAPVTVLWIEADGSEHQTDLLAVEGLPTTGWNGLTVAGMISGWAMFLAPFAVLAQWFRATHAWYKRPARRDRVEVGA